MKRKSFTPAERRRAVRLWLESDLSQQEIADDYGIALSTLKRWVMRYRADLEAVAR